MRLSEKGTGVSKDPTRIIGASKYSKISSVIVAEISPINPLIKVSSLKSNTLPVFFIELKSILYPME